MGSGTSRQQVAPASSNSRNKKVLSAAFGKSIWIASTCAPVMAKIWVARSTNAPVKGWLRRLPISAPSSAQTSTACELGGCPRTACTPADATSMSLRFPRDGEKDLPQWDCDKHYRYKRKGRFSQDAAARTLDGGQVRSHKNTPTRLGFIRLIYETSVEKIALPPGAHRPVDCGWPCASFAAARCCRSGKYIRRSRLALGSLWPEHCAGGPRVRLR